MQPQIKFGDNLKQKWLPIISNAAVLIIAIIGIVYLLHESSVIAGPANQPTRVQESRKMFNPDRQASILTESDSLEISLKKTETCSECVGKKLFIFQVKDKTQGTETQFTIQNQTSQIDSLYLVNQSRAVVFGSVDGTTRVVTIVDVTTGSVIDSFYCYFPTLSKTGQFIAYVKSIPRFSPLLNRSYVYLVYDLASSPENNRLLNSEKSDEVNVGTPVYPRENFQRSDYSSQVSTEQQIHSLASNGLFWLDENRLALVDRSNGTNSLIVVEMSKEGLRPKILAESIDDEAIIDTQICDESVERPENLIYVTDIMSLGDGVLRLSFKPRGVCLQRLTFDIKLID